MLHQLIIEATSMFRRTLILAGALATLGAAPAAFAPGLSFTIRSSVTSDGVDRPAGKGTQVQVLNGVLRFEGDAKDGEKASYVIFDPRAKRLSMVMTDVGQYMEIDLADSTAQALGAMASMMAAATVISDIEVSGSALGGGGVVNGYDTNRYRITTTYAEVAGGSEGQKKVRLVEEVWVTNELKDVPDPMEAMTRAFGGANGMPQLGGTMSDLMKKRGDAQRKLFTGLPLRSVVKSTLVERDGSTKEETSTTEIVDLKRVDLDAAAFRVPAGFTKMDMRVLTNLGARLEKLGGRPGRSNTADGSIVDDAKNAVRKEASAVADETKQESKDAAKDAAKGQVDAAKDKAKCALGGLFGRKKC
jgi:hypothetical protein